MELSARVVAAQNFMADLLRITPLLGGSEETGERNALEVEAERVRAELLASGMTQRLQLPCGAAVSADEIRKSTS
jgi:hypothetical protein